MFEETPLIGVASVESPTLILPEPLVVPKSRAPLIRIARKIRWNRDKLVQDLEDYFENEPKFQDVPDEYRWDLLTASEEREIDRCYQRCRNDFLYAAKNFFWITHKQRGDILFSLWESQELILEHIMRLKAKGVAQRVMILKARQLGCSTLIEGLIAWRAMFFANVNALVVSFDPSHAAFLFGIMQHIYDRMVWWLKPMCASREINDGLWFENPREGERRKNPGLNSRVRCEGANKLTGVGQGRSINACHLSELTDVDEDKAREIMEEDVGNALAEGPETFAIWESTGKGAGSYSHKLWNKQIELLELSESNVEWFPLFLPWFFESTRTRPPESGWRPKPEELAMRQRIETDWTRCDWEVCGMFHERWWQKRDREGENCPTCGKGKLLPYLLTRGQMRWMEWRRSNAKKDEESVRKLKQEQTSTASDAWQVSGVRVFTVQSEEYVDSMVRPPMLEGFFDHGGIFHAMNRTKTGIHHIDPDGHEWWNCVATGCQQDHSLGDERNEFPAKIWKMPESGVLYSCGADPAGGNGRENDYSVGAMWRVDRSFGKDELVAVFRSNTIHPTDFAVALNYFGRWYNNALMSVEVNRFDTVATWVRMQCNYPNLYRWKHMDSINILSNKLCWETNYKSKPRLIHNMQRFLQQKLVKIYSRNFLEEMKTFRSDFYDELIGAGATKNNHDDELMAAMIGLWCFHEDDFNENLGYVTLKREMTMDSAPWHGACSACHEKWPAESPEANAHCPKCGSLMITFFRNFDYQAPIKVDPEAMMMNVESMEQLESEPDYNLL